MGLSAEIPASATDDAGGASCPSSWVRSLSRLQLPTAAMIAMTENNHFVGTTWHNRSAGPLRQESGVVVIGMKPACGDLL